MSNTFHGDHGASTAALSSTMFRVAIVPLTELRTPTRSRNSWSRSSNEQPHVHSTVDASVESSSTDADVSTSDMDVNSVMNAACTLFKTRAEQPSRFCATERGGTGPASEHTGAVREESA
jgi:hypothetical protein